LLKLIVKAYTDDGCAKTVIIDETMKVYDIMLVLLNKNHFQPTTNYAVVEYLPKFNMSNSTLSKIIKQKIVFFEYFYQINRENIRGP
jgi:hypothetical protein